MNRLKPEKQAAVLSALVEGNSIRSTERMTGVHRDTIMRLSIRVGNACEKVLDQTMQKLPCRHVEVDEIWCYVGKKQRHIESPWEDWMRGNFWTWVAIDADTKLVPTYMVSKRDSASADIFIADLASRMANRIQLSSDKLPAYVTAVRQGFGEGNVDYGRIVKSYEAEPIGPGRYSPPKVTKVERDVVFGDPQRKISTSYVERQNLTMRMSMRRFTRLTNGFSKKLEGLEAAVALHFAHYNFIRKHRTLGTTPAIAAGVSDHVWTFEELLSA